MTEEVQQWIKKAYNDFQWSKRALDDDEEANPDLACFLCQQAIEKLMKAVLISRGIVPPKTHRLEDLHDQLQSIETQWSADRTFLHHLSRSAVDLRYPGEEVTYEEAKAMYENAMPLYDKLIDLLNYRNNSYLF